MNIPDTDWREVQDKVGYTLNVGENYTYIESRLTREEMQGIRKLIKHSLTSRDTYWKERVRKWIDENEYCSNCCSPKEFCPDWRESASAIDTKDLLQALDNLN